MGATVVEFDQGIAEVRLRERRKVRNHLGSVHAVALANLGELATGLAVVSALSPGTRGIVTELRIVFYKKARGLLTCRCSTELPPLGHGRVEHEARAEIRDPAGDVVAEVTAVWLLGAEPGASRT